MREVLVKLPTYLILYNYLFVFKNDFDWFFNNYRLPKIRLERKFRVKLENVDEISKISNM